MPSRRDSLVRMTAGAVLLAWIASLLLAAPALADGGPKPPNTGAGGGRSSGAHSSGSLDQLPSGTKVVILDARGEKLALGSQAAQDLLSSGDPLWCPSTVAKPAGGGLNGCTISDISLSNLVSDIYNGSTILPNANGTIWILGGSDGSITPAAIDGSDTLHFGSWANYALILKGAWDGFGKSTTTSPASSFAVPISIINWNNSIAISDITISGTTGAPAGLTVTTTKNITLTRVQSNGNAGIGAYLDNSLGTGTVSVTTGTFSGNSGDGLDVFSNGSITVSTITANGNTGGMGAYLDNSLAIKPQSVTVTGTANTFNNNYLNGLLVFSYGSITAGNLNASGNSAGVTSSNYLFSGGVQLENDFLGSSGITVTGTNSFTNNYEDGLDIYSNGAITTSNLTAKGNGVQGNPTGGWEWLGVMLYNASGLSPQNISALGTNDFENNFNDGIDASATGVLTINNLTAKNNGTSVGTISQIQGGMGAYLQGTRGVTLTGTNLVDGNYSTMTFDDGIPADYMQTSLAGLTVLSNSSIRVNNLTASDDLAAAGAYLDNCDNQGLGCVYTAGSITLTGLNTFNNNYMDGLDADSFGTISASNLNASQNLGMGALLVNANVSFSGSHPSKGSVVLSGSNMFMGNLDDGMDVYSGGAIKASNVQAVDNSGAGVVLENSSTPNVTPLQGTGVLPSVSSGGAVTAQPITLTNYNVFSNNGFDGLEVLASGAVTLSSMIANGNGAGYGVYIANDVTGFSSGVTLIGSDSFNSNYLDGLDILSYGTITVKTASLIADSNGLAGSNGVGVYLDNCINTGSGCTATLAKAVSFTGTSVINGNYGQYYDGINTYAEAGLVIDSKGAITAGSVSANGTVNGAGAVLDNSHGTSLAYVTMTGPSQFNENAGDGLDIASHGAVTMTKVIAQANLGTSGSPYNGDGVFVNTGGKVSLTCSDILDNAGHGLSVLSAISLTLKGSLVDGNLAGNVNYAGTPVLSVACLLP